MVGSFFSQSEFYLGSQCGLECSFCAQSKLDPKLLNDTIISGSFFQRYPKTAWVNVVGGSVESFESLSFLITYLKSEGIKVRFWNQGVVDVDVIEGILDRCDEIILYCPSVDERLYQELSHESTFEEFKDCVDRLKESTALCKIQTPVLVDYIGDLPDIHEFVRGHGLEWILHYHKEELNRDQKDIVARYFNIPKVDVYKVTGQGVPRCVALPFPAYKSRFYYVKNKLSNVLAKTR